jgi:hypothetical protein
MDIESKNIDPDDELRVLLPAAMIGNGGIVSKRTGRQTFTLAHNIKVYRQASDQAPITIEGFFLLNNSGSINQVDAETELHWHVTAQDLVDILQIAWEPEEQ